MKRVQFFSDLFESEAALFDHSQIPEIRAKGTSRTVALLPLRPHRIYGKTVLTILEKYNNIGEIEEYRYGWELADLKGKQKAGKKERHITSFDKQPHPKPPRHVKTDPFHHHHIPRDPVQRTETRVQSLEEFISILRSYIENDSEFHPDDTFTG